ncbi:MAG: flagellar hook-length control protein FliK, partial [Phycisphaerae bacterium]|nr:flagellar hook-length control protein FliK [Phycisphaerae bacterium]
ADSDTAVSIRNQIQESIYTSFRSDSKEIVVRLNPPELGKVAIKFSEQNNAITGLLQVDNLETKNSIQQSLPEIIQSLNDGGVLVKKIEVVLTSQQEQYMPKEHSAAGQQNWAGNQSSSNHESQKNNGFYGESFRYAESSAELMETQGLLTDNYINVLV